MKLSAPWHRKAASPRVRGSGEARVSLADGAQIEDALETAIAGLRGVIAHVRSNEALSDLSGEIDALAQSSAPRSAALDGDALANLDQRIAAIADGIAALRAENRRRAAQNFDTVIGVLSEKIELLEAAQKGAVNSTAPDRSHPAQPRPELHLCKFDSIERGIADLVRSVHEARTHVDCCLARLAEVPSPETPVRPEASTTLRQAAPDIPDPAPAAPASSKRNQAFRRAFPKLMLGLALAIGSTAVLQLGLSQVRPRPVAESAKPATNVADRGPRLDSASVHAAPGTLASIPDLSAAANLPLAIGARLIVAAAAGDPAAAYEVGVRLTQRLGPAATEQAVSWLDRAAKAGIAPAQLALGGIYEKGLGVAKDPGLARVYYLAAAQRGNAKAMHNLAVLYAQGAGGNLDYASAAQWFRKAAMHGLTDSQFNLAVLYERGAGVECNPIEAYKWFALAARHGDPAALEKRDEIAQQLDAGQRASVKAGIESFAPQPEADEAVRVRPPPGGWDQAPAEPRRTVRGPQFVAGLEAVEQALAQRMR
ncbi:MAG: sel1 repeat family protein [Xanthobacteraceae bacterium]|nr:sel1 repeat family protein [Xanthobacteraceae bacterium]